VQFVARWTPTATQARPSRASGGAPRIRAIADSSIAPAEASPALPRSHLARLAELDEERTAGIRQVLDRAGGRRSRSSRCTTRVTDVHRRRERLQRTQRIGLKIVCPRSSNATVGMLDFARSNRLPFTWRDWKRADDPAAAALIAELDVREAATRRSKRLGHLGVSVVAQSGQPWLRRSAGPSPSPWRGSRSRRSSRRRHALPPVFWFGCCMSVHPRHPRRAMSRLADCPITVRCSDAVARRFGECTEHAGDRAVGVGVGVGVDQQAHGAGRFVRAVPAAHREPQRDSTAAASARLGRPVPVSMNTALPRRSSRATRS
jgi:hypothetical protein